jgi:hypothetical protein
LSSFLNAIILGEDCLTTYSIDKVLFKELTINLSTLEVNATIGELAFIQGID